MKNKSKFESFLKIDKKGVSNQVGNGSLSNPISKHTNNTVRQKFFPLNLIMDSSRIL